MKLINCWVRDCWVRDCWVRGCWVRGCWVRGAMRGIVPVVAALALATGGCGTQETKPDTAGAETGENTEVVAEDGSVAGDAPSDAATATSDAPDSNTGETTGTTDGGSDTGTTELDVATSDGDVAAGTDAATVDDVPDAGTVDGGPPKPKLPLPECAQGNPANCLNTSKCPEYTICVDGQTFVNDCDAIVKLKAFDWPTGYEDKLSKGACPACAACGKVQIKCDTTTKTCQQCDAGVCAASNKPCTANAACAEAFPVCATLPSDAKQTVAMMCLTKCMELKQKPDASGPDVTVGACKSSCSQPEPNGGGCSMGVYQPVCAKEDGKTYASLCALNHCDLQGCFAVGGTSKSDKCQAGKLTKECDGECFAEASQIKESAKNCPTDCNAVCGIMATGKGQSFRNTCLATNAGAKVKDCTGIASTTADKCSAGELYEGKGCCPDVDYTNVKQVCASKQAAKAGDADTWITFRSNAEYKCLTAGDNMWVKQYDGPCICNCNNIEKPFCGDDGLTYTNKCQADCYNPPNGMTGKPGPC